MVKDLVIGLKDSKAEEKIEEKQEEVSTSETAKTYETDPKKAYPDQIINLGTSVYFLPTGERNNSTIRLCQGDRLRGKYYVEMLEKKGLQRIQLVSNCTTAQLIAMEAIRKNRTKETPEKWITEAWALKENKEDEKRASQPIGKRPLAKA